MKRSAAYALLVTIVAGAAASAVQAATKPIGCLIQPDRVADVGSPVVGVVETMLVERGDTVRKGQVIAILRNEADRASLTVARTRAQAEADVLAARANLEFARQRLVRAQDLQQRNFISTQALDQTTTEMAVARQKLAQTLEQQRIWADEVGVARARVEDRIIRSPFDGLIAERYVSVGERIEERPLVRVAKVDPLRVEVIMPSALFGSVTTGSMARITPDLAGAAAINARVTLVDRILDAASGTFRVRLELPNPNASIPAGLRCKCEFAAETGGAGTPPAPRASSETSLKPARLKLDWKVKAPALEDISASRRM